jgi:NADH dehydrogenase FAD-containing subunit
VKSPVEGELVSVDAEAKKVTVKPASGPELMFAYTETTEASGAQKDAAGLATMKEARVTVHFTEDAKTKARTATRIIVQPKQ